MILQGEFVIDVLGFAMATRSPIHFPSSDLPLRLKAKAPFAKSRQYLHIGVLLLLQTFFLTRSQHMC